MSRSQPIAFEEGAIIAVWRRLSRLTRLHLVATSDAASTTGWCGRGEARVNAQTVGSSSVRLHEQGYFTPSGSERRIAFANTCLWQLDGTSLTLFHERFGADAPVHLLDFQAAGDTRLTGAAPHQCGADRYHAHLDLTDTGVTLRWEVSGPRKAETLRYHYQSDPAA